MAKVFISHSTVDKPFVRRLQKDLENMGLLTWIDEEKAFAGYVLGDSLEQGIQDCTHFLIIISPNSVKSDWVKREIEKAISLFGKRNIIPVIYRKADIPSVLMGLIYVDFSDIIFTLNNDMTIVNYHGPEYPEGIKKIMAAIRNSEPQQFTANKPWETTIAPQKTIPDNPKVNLPIPGGIKEDAVKTKQVIPIKCKINSFPNEHKKKQLIQFVAQKHPHIITLKNLTPIVFPADLRAKFSSIDIGETIFITGNKNNKNMLATHFCGFVSNIDTILLSNEIILLLGLNHNEHIWVTVTNVNNIATLTILD